MMPLDPSLVRFRALMEGALGELEARRQEINDLNVFPVADGDTGDNMATPDAPPAKDHRDWLDRARDQRGADAQGERHGRLRKWVMTEYEPVKSEEVYVEGSGQPGERPSR